MRDGHVKSFNLGALLITVTKYFKNVQHMKKAKCLWMACGVLLFSRLVSAQATFPENGVADPRHGHYAFTNATIVKDANTTLSNATLVIKDGKIIAVGSS